jgi:O-antigen/teichoic acid export membrane protein
MGSWRLESDSSVGGVPRVATRIFFARKTVIALRSSRNFRDSAGNAFYSIAEYVAQPLSMLVAAPYLVHKLGLSQYGIWMLVSAILGSMGILSTGFGDATVKYVSAYRGQNNPAGVERTIRATLTINALLGGLFALLIWIAAPYTVDHLFKIDPDFYSTTVLALRISAIILAIRSIESVFVSTLRAFERYGPPVKLNVFLRTVVVISAVVLAALGRGVAAIMFATLFWSALVVVLQVMAARRVVSIMTALPTFNRSALAEVFSFGCFSWLQALAGVAFAYADRFLIAGMIGTTPLAIYVLCVQATQPIHGLGAAAFNFIFPHISYRREAGELDGPRRVFRLASWFSLAISVALAFPLIAFGRPLLRLWMGNQIANDGHIVLALLAAAYALLAVNVVPHYALLAFGRVRFVAGLNFASGLFLVAAMAVLVPAFGLVGAAIGRITYSLVLVVPYLLLARAEFRSRGELVGVDVT